MRLHHKVLFVLFDVTAVAVDVSFLRWGSLVSVNSWVWPQFVARRRKRCVKRAEEEQEAREKC